MRIFNITFFFFLAQSCLAQNFLLVDSAMLKALLPEGYSNANIPFEKFKVLSVDGKIFTDDSLKGKVTFVNCWFQNCAPCLEEFPFLTRLYNKYKNNSDFQMISFSFDPVQDIEKVVKQNSIDYSIISMRQFDLNKLMFNLGFPTNLVVDRNGKIQFVKCGGSTDPKSIKYEFESIYYQEIDRILKL